MTSVSSSFPADVRPGVWRLRALRALAAVSGWSLLRWAPPILVMTTLVLAWWLTALRLQAQERQLMDNAQTQQAGLAAMVHESLMQAIEKGHLMALAAAEALDEDPEGVARTRRRLLAMQAADRTFVRYAVLDGQMELVSSSAAPADMAAQQRLLQALRPRLAQAPLASRQALVVLSTEDSSQAWQVPLLLPIPAYALAQLGAAEQLVPASEGYLLLTLDMAYFLELYRDVDLRRGSSIHLLGSDGTVLVEMQGDSLTPSPSTRRLPELAQYRADKGYQQLRLADQELHLASWRRSVGMPITVVVSQALQELRAEYRGNSQRVWGLLSVMTAITVLAALALTRALGRQHSLFQALEAVHGQNQTLIGQLEQEKTRALELAACDHLTGLHNRRMFNELVASHLALARRSPKHYALLYLDLDRFKHINDTLGHHVGDQLLQAVAQRLRTQVRGSDIVGRMGGDEFALLATAMEQMTDMEPLAVKLLDCLSQPYDIVEGGTTHRLQVSPSMGIAFFPRDGHDVDSLCRHADAAMYASKRAGRGRYTYYDTGLNPSDGRSWQLECELAQAIADNQLVLHFQPKVRLDDCRIEGFEALVRWQHPRFGLVYPGDFIGLAEKNGLIVELGDWVIRACCQQAAAWRMQGLDMVPIAFNVSPLQLRDAAFPTRMATYLMEYGVRASDLEVEITESCLVEPVDLAVRVLSQLEGMGMRIGLDDFGTGFSSLSQIRNLPIDTIKLDRSFVDDIRSSPEAGVLVTSIITLAHNLKMRVVAEGVELRDQLVYLKTAGCDVAQGYILSRPVPADEAQRLLRRGVLEPA
ncbi:putative bifunctional diguanylate cyclase/phosphodiesterase [Comamonas sp. GB3 AK4-5]|uniref:putative bifunctional diguanylate cyclase/phosphodiesterase n=1 Tax=Comamonas sp. GB3 AK4-5 TaxID=3231487 RepID=UPI00351E86BB